MPTDLQIGADLRLTAEQSHYLCTVLRKKQGDEVVLFNEKSGAFLCVLETAHKKKAVLNLREKIAAPQPTQPLHLIIAPLKKQTTDMVVQKATECGVSDIHFIKTQYTNAERIKLERLEAIAKEAAEQCERFDIPAIHALCDLETVLKSGREANWQLFAGAEDGSGARLNKTMIESSHVPALIIGPEGGFAPDEFKRMEAHGAVMLDFGPRILRTETATIVGLSLLDHYRQA